MRKFAKRFLEADMNKFVFPFLSAYWSNSSTQDVSFRLVEEWREPLDDNYVVGSVSMDLSKAFDCISHDLPITKLDTYGFNRNLLCYVYLYIEKRKQCVRISSVTSSFKHILSGVSQGSMLGPTLFNLFFHDLFCILIASAHNFADGNRFSSSAGTVEDLIEPLQSECNLAIKWFIENKMFVDPDKLQAILFDKQKSDYTVTELFALRKFKLFSSVNIFGVAIDDKLNFDLRIDRICKSALNQLNALRRLKNRKEGGKKGFNIYKNFHYKQL